MAIINKRMSQANKYSKCKYPDCIGNVLPGKTTVGLCAKHTEQLRFLIWALNSIVLSDEAKMGSGSIIPNKKEVIVK